MKNYKPKETPKELEIEKLKHILSLTPEQRLMNLKKMIFAEYNIKDETDLKVTERKIHFPGKTTYTNPSK